jgi:hypothetical protein
LLTKEHLDKESNRIRLSINDISKMLSEGKKTIKSTIDELLSNEKEKSQKALDLLKETLNNEKLNYSKEKESLKTQFELGLLKFKTDKLLLLNSNIKLIEDKVKEIKELNNKKISQIVTKNDILTSKFNDILVREVSMNNVKNTHIEKTYILKQSESNLIKSMESYNNILGEIEQEKDKKFDVDIKSLVEKEIVDNQLIIRLSEAIGQIGVNIKNNKIIEKILSEDGIKTYFINSILMSLNNQINSYLDLFNLPIKIEFDNTLEEKIVDAYNKPRSYESFSSGEQKRIDLSIILSFLEIQFL